MTINSPFSILFHDSWRRGQTKMVLGGLWTETELLGRESRCVDNKNITSNPFCPESYPPCVFSPRYFQPLQLVVGATVVTLLFPSFVWVAENQASVRCFRRNHPTISLLAILLASYLFVLVLGGVALFLFGIAFPLLSKAGTHIHKYITYSFHQSIFFRVAVVVYLCPPDIMVKH